MTKAEADVLFKDEIALLMGSLAIETTGNYEQDMAHIYDSARSTCMIQAGFCPNGCGKMNRDVLNRGASCPVCGFSHHVSTL